MVAKRRIERAGNAGPAVSVSHAPRRRRSEDGRGAVEGTVPGIRRRDKGSRGAGSDSLPRDLTSGSLQQNVRRKPESPCLTPRPAKYRERAEISLIRQVDDVQVETRIPI